MITVSKGVLKAKMLEYFRRVEETGEELIVTSHRKPVLRIEPINKKKTVRELFKDVHGHLECSEDDLLKPETEEWENMI